MPRTMPRKVILDMDPGYDDAIALCLALATPELEVLAVTATGGSVSPSQATRNLQIIVEQLDPPRWSTEQILETDARHLHGYDGLCGANFEVAELANRHRSLKVLSDEIRNAPDQVTVVTTGPLTNVAELLYCEPESAAAIDQLIILGGSLSASGDATAAAEFNIYCDAEAAKQVFQSPITKTIIPIDLTSQLILGFDFSERIKRQKTRTSAFIEQVLPGAYRNCRQHLGIEGIFVRAAVAMVAAIRPALFVTERMHGDVETLGELTRGATIFDRRPVNYAAPNMDVAVEMDIAGVEAVLIAGIESGQ